MGFQSMTTIICEYKNHQETNDGKSVYFFLFSLVKSGRLFGLKSLSEYIR